MSEELRQRIVRLEAENAKIKGQNEATLDALVHIEGMIDCGKANEARERIINLIETPPAAESEGENG